MAEKQFDISKFSVIALTPAPIDISSGLVLDGTFFSVENQDKDESSSRSGTKDEVYTVVHQENKTKKLMLKYIPSAQAVVILQTLRKTKAKFGIQLKNDSSPKWICSSDDCSFMETPKVSADSKKGFEDYEFIISMKNSIEENFPEV